MFPSGNQRARSPVQYIRAPPSFTNGSTTKRSAVSSARFIYPRATPAPPMYGSPATPSGAGSPFASNMYICVFAIGRPIGTDFLFNVLTQWYTVAHTVLSVGPYSLNNRFWDSIFADFAINSAGQRSPARITLVTRASHL